MFQRTLPGRSQFAEEFRGFALADEKNAAAQEAVLFYGSSSVRLWSSLAADFAGWRVVNRGFGGSTLADCVAEMEWLVVPAKPRAIVLYAGDNDLDRGTQPEEVRALFERFLGTVRECLGATPVVWVSIKPSPTRLWNVANIRRANMLVEEAISGQPNVRCVDVFHPMLNSAGEPRRELFAEDGLHMSAAGYALWAALVRDALASFDLPRML